MRSLKLYLVLATIAIGIVALQAGAYYYFQRVDVPSGSCPVAVCTLINYGNGTMKWYNETSFGAGWNFYTLTVFLTRGNVEAQFDARFNEHLVTGINGKNNGGELSWSIWLFCGKFNGWLFSPVGADEIRLSIGQTLAWSYGSQHQPPVERARTVDSCS